MTQHGPGKHEPRLTEEDFLDLVEDPRPAARLASLSPALQEHLARLRADRACLQSLGECPAPAGLVAAAARVAERRALLDLEGAAPAALPVSVVRPPRRPSLLETFFADRLTRRLALAAGLTLLAGGVALVATLGGPRPRPVTISHSQPAGPASPGPSGEAPALALSNTTNEAGEGGESVPEPAALPSAAETTVAAADGAEGPAPMPLERAVRLARENRLAVRIIAPSTARAGLSLDRLGLRDRAGETWRLAGIVPPGAAAAIRGLLPALPEPRPATIAEALPPPGAGVEAAAPRPLGVEPPEGIVYFADVRLEEGSLSALLAALSEETGETARFEELAAPLPAPHPPLSLDAVVWWAQPAAAWEFWGRVPVAIDPAAAPER